MDKQREQQIGQAIGEALAYHRKRSGMTQEQIAERLQVERETISRFERGVIIPTVTRLYELADLFGCTVGDLLTQSSIRPADQIHTLSETLSRMNERDRALALKLVQELAEHFDTSP